MPVDHLLAKRRFTHPACPRCRETSVQVRRVAATTLVPQRLRLEAAA